jgi:hypothetical protein
LIPNAKAIYGLKNRPREVCSKTLKIVVESKNLLTGPCNRKLEFSDYIKWPKIKMTTIILLPSRQVTV